MNRLYYGNNLTVLRNVIADDSVDLVYLDPPFNSQASYNLLFRSTAGEKSRAQIEAFDDTWHWGEEAELAFDGVMSSQNSDAAEMLRALRMFLKENDMMAYVCMMSIRLLELYRVMKTTGTIFLHCDPTACHYLKLIMDAIFGADRFINEVVWKRTYSHGDAKRNFGSVFDVILIYSKTDEYKWNRLMKPLSEAHVSAKFRAKDKGRPWQSVTLRSPNPRPNLDYPYTASNGETYHPHPNGWSCDLARMQSYDTEGRLHFPAKPTGQLRLRMYLDESKGMQMQNVWDDIPPINSQAQERLGYPTQKPQALLERILSAASNEGNIVLDPFCGCGTTIHAAQKLKRQWIGIDITHLAISLIEKRLKDAFPGIAFEVHGTPKDLDGARDLAMRDKYQFQWWAVSLVNAVPFAGKKGADSGIDGIIYFKPEMNKTEKAIVSVKGGENVSVSMVRDLAHVVDREKAKVGIFVTLAESTGPMRIEAVKAGYYEAMYGKYPKIQIFTIKELFAGERPKLPALDDSIFKKAPKEEIKDQDRLF